MTNMATYTQEHVGNCVHLYTGNKFNVLEPSKDDVNIVDIAHGLSRLVRYTGAIEEPYTVGHHSILCSRVAEALELSNRLRLIALLHDATECIVGDLNRIVKQLLPEYKALEDKIALAIWDALGIEPPTEEEYKIIKKIDNCLLVNEIIQLTNREHKFDHLEYYDIKVDIIEGVRMNEIRDKFLDEYIKLRLELEQDGEDNE